MKMKLINSKAVDAIIKQYEEELSALYSVKGYSKTLKRFREELAEYVLEVAKRKSKQDKKEQILEFSDVHILYAQLQIGGNTSEADKMSKSTSKWMDDMGIKLSKVGRAELLKAVEVKMKKLRKKPNNKKALRRIGVR